MHVRKQLTGDRTDLLGASVAEAALILQSIRHEIIRCERRANDNQMSENSRELEVQSVKVLRHMEYHIKSIFIEKTPEQ